MKKIIAIGPLPPPLNGQTLAFNALVDELKLNEFDITTINISSTSNGKVKRILEYIKYFYKFNRALNKQTEIVYLTTAQSFWGFLRDLMFILKTKNENKKIITHLHGGNFKNFYESQNFLMKNVIKFVYRRIDKNIVLGNQLVNMFDFDSQINNSTIVIANGIDVEVTDLEIDQKINNISNLCEIKILYLSNLIETKGYFKLLKVSKELILNNPRLEIHFAGEFIYLEKDKILFNSKEEAIEAFNRFITDNKIENNIFYHGVVKDSKKKNLLLESNILVLPTSYSNEGQPLSIIEAMAYGCPTITTNYRAIPDLIENNENGILINPDFEEQHLFTAINNLINNTKLLKHMSYSSRKKYLEKFTLKIHTNNVRQYFRD